MPDFADPDTQTSSGMTGLTNEKCTVVITREMERAHDTLQQIGWFDGLVFTAPVNDTLRPLLDAASEKYGCEGAELLERLCVVAMTDMSGEEMHTVKESDE